MEKRLAIVRDCYGAPHRRVALIDEKGRIRVSSERSVAAVCAGEIPAIGCPDGDLFEFDAAKFDQMDKEWNENARVSDFLWQSLTPFQVA